MLQAGAIVADHLRLIRQLGSGGMGSVWVAEQTRLGGLVAVKFLSTALLDHESARSRFDREAKLAAKIKSQHVVQVHDHGVTRGQPAIPYIVMELLEGTDLSKVLDREGALGLTRAAEIVDQVADALTKAHDAGIVHRDIKPENVFLLDEAKTFVKLLDFGVAHGKDGQLDRLTQTGLLLGTAHYMSPEQLFSGKDIDPRADLWALGVLTYQMLTNEVPFQAETFGQLCLQVRDGGFTPVSSKVNVPPSLDQWFLKALATDRAERFRSAMEMASAFRRALAGEVWSAGAAANASATHTTGTGTVKVGRSEVARLRDELVSAGAGADASSPGGLPPATQRLGSQGGLSTNPAQHVTDGDLLTSRSASRDDSARRLGRQDTSLAEGFGDVSSSSDVSQRSAHGSATSPNAGDTLSSSTPMANLSGSFGTEAKGVLAVSTRDSERKPPNKGRWMGWLAAALALGAGVLYVVRAPRDVAPEVNPTTSASAAPIVVADVVKPAAEVVNSAEVPTVASISPPGASGASENEMPAAEGEAASPSQKNAVVGRSAPASPGSPASSGARAPKTSGVARTPNSNAHAPTPSPEPPSPTPAPAPAPVAPSQPAATPKAKYRGF